MKKTKSILTPLALVSLAVFLLVSLLYLASELSRDAADYINNTVSHAFREFLAGVGDLFPFSLSEIVILLSPVWVSLIIYVGIVRLSHGEGVKFLVNFISVALIFYSGHILALGIAYNTTPIAEKMQLPSVEVSEEGLKDALTVLRDEVNALARELPRNEDGVFVCDLSLDGISELICSSYEEFSEKDGVIKSFDSRAKGVRAGNLMSYLKITGIYTYFTGEANVNTAYPSYDMIFTSAHEMAHQRGILKEDEANFVAYVVNSTSEDIALRYSAALTMYEYISSALYRTSEDAYYEIAKELSSLAKNDISASRAVTEKYGNTVIGEISERINDLFLKSNGTDGIVSYSQSVRLTLAYLESIK